MRTTLYNLPFRGVWKGNERGQSCKERDEDRRYYLVRKMFYVFLTMAKDERWPDEDKKQYKTSHGKNLYYLKTIGSQTRTKAIHRVSRGQ